MKLKPIYKPLNVKPEHLETLKTINRGYIVYEHPSGGWFVTGGNKPKRLSAAHVKALADAGYLIRYDVDAGGKPENRVRVSRGGAVMLEAHERGIFDQKADYVAYTVEMDMTKELEDALRDVERCNSVGEDVLSELTRYGLIIPGSNIGGRSRLTDRGRFVLARLAMMEQGAK